SGWRWRPVGSSVLVRSAEAKRRRPELAIDVTVEPATFHLVDYDADTIAALVAEAAGWFGFDGPITVRVDEGSPLGDVVVESADPVVLAVEGGAFEDLKYIRKLSPVLVQTVVARVVGRIADRRHGFDAPPDAEITTAQQDAWDAWLLGGASRHQLALPQARRL